MENELVEYRQRFAKRIESALSDLGIPVSERISWLSDAADVTYPAARGWIRAKTLPDTNRMEKLAHKLGVSISWLITGKENAGASKAGSSDDRRIRPDDMLQLISFFSSLDADEREFFLRLANDPVKFRGMFAAAAIFRDVTESRDAKAVK